MTRTGTPPPALQKVCGIKPASPAASENVPIRGKSGAAAVPSPLAGGRPQNDAPAATTELNCNCFFAYIGFDLHSGVLI
jgi:hypothetical protein